jgi:chemotaxis methyl-accepting protein methylase
VSQAVSARLCSLGLDGVQYLEHLAAAPNESRALAEAILVPHTRFFRDEAVFDALRDVVVPALAPADELLRGWVVGAATGEEAWSLAVALHEALGSLERFEVLATDVDGAAIEQAASGRYLRSKVSGVSADRLARHFRPGDTAELIAVQPALRSRVRFARHDLVGPTLAPTEAILARFQLVSCRNLLIWFDARLRGVAVHRLRAVVPEGGALVLGLSEALPDDERGFAPWPGLAATLRIYQRTGSGR